MTTYFVENDEQRYLHDDLRARARGKIITNSAPKIHPIFLNVAANLIEPPSYAT